MQIQWSFHKPIQKRISPGRCEATAALVIIHALQKQRWQWVYTATVWTHRWQGAKVWTHSWQQTCTAKVWTQWWQWQGANVLTDMWQQVCTEKVWTHRWQQACTHRWRQVCRAKVWAYWWQRANISTHRRQQVWTHKCGHIGGSRPSQQKYRRIGGNEYAEKKYGHIGGKVQKYGHRGGSRYAQQQQYFSVVSRASRSYVRPGFSKLSSREGHPSTIEPLKRTKLPTSWHLETRSFWRAQILRTCGSTGGHFASQFLSLQKE